jgi:hypothetical protein
LIDALKVVVPFVPTLIPIKSRMMGFQYASEHLNIFP